MVDVDALARNLSKLTVADLKKELSARALPAAGAKAVLLSRLEASLKVSSSSEGEDDTEAARRDTAPPPPLDAVFSSRTASRSSSTASASSSLSRGRAGTTVRSSVESVRSSSSSSSSASSAAAAPGAATSGPARHPVVLILDETLQRLPWESLPSLRGRPVSRCPSLAYVRAALLGRRRAGDNGSGKGKGKDKKPRSAAATTKGRRTTGAASASIAAAVEMKDDEPGVACVPSAPGYYLLDPEANLPDTRATLQPALARLAAAHGTKATEWSGVVGQAPEEASLKAHLGAASVFVYCGHGSGELFLPREDVAAMPQAPFAILMGCSSGRLKAPTPAFEPGGMVLSYLAAGAPAVVGNLWDVTDKDIDRFSLALLERLFHHNEEEEDSGEGSGGGLVLEAVAAARAACKLPFLVGAAPVVYGLPLRVVNGKRARR